MSAKDRRKKGKSLKRSAGIQQEKKTFRIYTEVKSTEPEYIEALKHLPEIAEAVSIDISIEGRGATPKRLVDDACDHKRRSKLEVDQYWCVFDVEHPKQHPYLVEAKQKAKDNEVFLAVSNPCFELWLVLHHTDHFSHLTNQGAISLRKSLDKSSDKHLVGEKYMKSYEKANRRARTLRKKHAGDCTKFPNDNPSSSFDLLLKEIFTAVESAKKLSQQ